MEPETEDESGPEEIKFFLGAQAPEEKIERE